MGEGPIKLPCKTPYITETANTFQELYGTEEEIGQVPQDCDIVFTDYQSWIHHCATALTCRPMGKRKVGRPKTTWRRTVEKERTMAGWKFWEEARALAKDRDKRRKSSAALCATEREEDW